MTTLLCKRCPERINILEIGLNKINVTVILILNNLFSYLIYLFFGFCFFLLWYTFFDRLIDTIDMLVISCVYFLLYFLTMLIAFVSL